MSQTKSLILRDPKGQNWLVRVYHENGIRQLYTTKTDEEGENSVRIKTYQGYYKLKISTKGQLITFPIDSIG